MTKINKKKDSRIKIMERQIQTIKFQQALYRVIKNNNKQSKKMTQKSLLISSMEKLINHVRKSQANQEQIFYSLSRNDFKKILSNLQDDNISILVFQQVLRKTSLNLITQLLSGNSKLKKKFCQTMDINLLPGKVLFNPKTIEKNVVAANFRALMVLLKKQCDLVQSDCLLWYIKTKAPNRELQLQYIYKDKNKVQMQVDLDPQQCIVGFCLSQTDMNVERSTANLSVTTTQVSQQSKKSQLKNLIQPNPKKVISIVGSKINSSMSDNQPRYQRNNKSINSQTDRPKKFINNFLHQRKIGTGKGSQTQRYNTQTSQLSMISMNSMNMVKNQPSYEIQKDGNRNTMPKSSQSPFVPTLNLQNTGMSMGYRTDRIGQSYTTTNNRSKEMDFQKIKYQGIKLTANTNRSSYGNNPPQKNNTDRDHPYTSATNGYSTSTNSYMLTSLNTNQPRRQPPTQNSFNFKYIKPVTSTNNSTEGVKYVNFFHKKHEEQPLVEKKTIDVFQFIKNK